MDGTSSDDPPTFRLRENDYVLGDRKVGGNAQSVGSGGFLFVFAHERALALEKRGGHSARFAVGLEGDDELAAAGVSVSDVGDRHAGISDRGGRLGGGVHIDDLASTRLARGVVWRDKDKLAVRCAQDDFLFPLIEEGRGDLTGDSEVEGLVLGFAGLVIDDEEGTVGLDEEGFRAPFIDTEQGVFGVGEGNAFQRSDAGWGEERPDLQNNKNKNSQHGGDNQRAAEFDKNRHEPIDQQGQLRGLKAVLLSGVPR